MRNHGGEGRATGQRTEKGSRKPKPRQESDEPVTEAREMRNHGDEGRATGQRTEKGSRKPKAREESDEPVTEAREMRNHGWDIRWCYTQNLCVGST